MGLGLDTGWNTGLVNIQDTDRLDLDTRERSDLNQYTGYRYIRAGYWIRSGSGIFSKEINDGVKV